MRSSMPWSSGPALKAKRLRPIVSKLREEHYPRHARELRCSTGREAPQLIELDRRYFVSRRYARHAVSNLLFQISQALAG